MFSVRLEAGGAEFPVGQLPVAVEANISADITLAAEGVALIYPEDARRVVVCDVDDTIAETGMGSKLRAGMQAIFGDPVSTKPVRGMSELLYALAAGGGGEQPSPIFYVSGGPVNFYPRVSAFLSMHGFPEGALMLRNFGRGPGNDPWSVEQYKMDRIEGLLGLFEKSRFLLVGDSTEKDPEAYAALRKRHAERIEAILIRRVDGKAGADAQDDRFKDMILFDDGADALRSAIGAGLVRQPEPASAAPEGASHEEHHLQAGGPE
jgi:phosphatidate phosphatase APP1